MTQVNHLFSEIRSAIRDGSAPFIETPDGLTLTYDGLVARSAAYANALVALGVTPGDRVAVQVEKSADALMLYLGTVRAGGVFLPLNTAYTPAEVEYFIGDAKPAVVVCDPARREAIAPIAEKTGARLETLDGTGKGSVSTAADEAATDFQDVARGADDLAAILYTSAPRAGPRAPCSATRTWPPTRACWFGSGASPRMTCFCTRCRSSIRTVSSSPPT